VRCDSAEVRNFFSAFSAVSNARMTAICGAASSSRALFDVRATPLEIAKK
jgi:hypothetical protein